MYASQGRAIVSVGDNGPGIAEDALERIFEPFFTTRREGGGMGLGLALCREYARRMNAWLTVSSAPGRGACFRLSLPMPSESAAGRLRRVGGARQARRSWHVKAAAARASGAEAPGSVNWKVLPWPGALSAQMRPPRACTRPRAMLKPSPSPGCAGG